VAMVKEKVEMNGTAYKKIKAYATKQWTTPELLGVLLPRYRTFDNYFKECLKEWKTASHLERKKLCPK